MAERVPYFELTAAEQQALHDWCALHGVDHTRVPVDARLEIDPATGEWLIDTYALRGGRPFVRPGEQDPARTVLRRASKADLPWRTR